VRDSGIAALQEGGEGKRRVRPGFDYTRFVEDEAGFRPIAVAGTYGVVRFAAPLMLFLQTFPPVLRSSTPSSLVPPGAACGGP
jgi:hypothetical protein